MSIRDADPFSAGYTRDYNNGWRAGRKYTEVRGLTPLERADQRNASHAWYDGYHDRDAGRPKWTWREARRRGFESIEEMYAADTEKGTVTVKKARPRNGPRVTLRFSRLPDQVFGPYAWTEAITDLTISALLPKVEARNLVLDALVRGEATTNTGR